MITKTLTYKDFNGMERKETFYFNLTKAEVAKMEMSVDGGFAERIQRIVDAKNIPEIIEIFEGLIQKAYGVKTPDGRGFVKRKEDLEAFMATEAYSDLFMELATDTEKAIEFVKGIIPANDGKPAAIPAAN